MLGPFGSGAPTNQVQRAWTQCMQEYFKHAASDGTLATLGDLGAEEEFYSAAARSMHSTLQRKRLGELQRELELQGVLVGAPLSSLLPPLDVGAFG